MQLCATIATTAVVLDSVLHPFSRKTIKDLQHLASALLKVFVF